MMPGHHSYKRDRNYRERIGNKFQKAHELGQLASHHTSRAGGIEHQLERSIFSDDPDAVEAIRAKVAALEQRREWYKRVNAAWRKAKKPAADNGPAWEAIAAALDCLVDDLTEGRKNLIRQPYHGQPYPAYCGQNIGGNISRLKARIGDIERRKTRQAAAEAAGGTLVTRSQDGRSCSVTFEEKPDRAVLNALKAAGFFWSGGSWHGMADKLPEGIEP